MMIYQKVSREIEEPVSIVCDKCKKKFSLSSSVNLGEPDEFLRINFVGGYNSVFGDGVTVQCDLCQNCLKELIGNIVRLDETAEYKK